MPARSKPKRKRDKLPPVVTVAQLRRSFPQQVGEALIKLEGAPVRYGASATLDDVVDQLRTMNGLLLDLVRRKKKRKR